jgi:hypothetical protein
VGLAFDGKDLLVSCVGGNGQGHTFIDYINPSDGSLAKSLDVNLPGIAAVAYDAGRGKIWACDSPTGGNSPGSGTEVFLIDPATGSATDEFPTRGCWDGLAYDAADGTVWSSPDQSDTIYHYKSDGTFIGSHSGLTAELGGFGNSGIAVGGPNLYLSNADGDMIYSAPKDFSSAPTPIATDTTQQHIEDMECDSVTFAPKDAMWVIDAFGRTVSAYEIPQGTCGVGGQTVQQPTGRPVITSSKPSVHGSNGAGFSGVVNPNNSPTNAFFQYGLDKRYTNPGSSGPQYTQSTPVHFVGSNAGDDLVTASVTNLIPNALYHVRLVATNGHGTSFGPDQTFTTPHGALPPPPTLGKSFNAAPVSGVVYLVLGNKLIPLTEDTKIPAGAILDTLHGQLLLTSASGGVTLAGDARSKKAKKSKTFKGTFGGAVFKATQTKSGPNKGQTTLTLVEGRAGAPSYKSCKAKGSADSAHTALSSRVLSRLRSRASGRYRTRGRYAAGTVRGTSWTTTDRCDGTLIAVQQHSVLVTDLVKHITILVRAGHHYLARAPKHK